MTPCALGRCTLEFQDEDGGKTAPGDVNKFVEVYADQSRNPGRFKIQKGSTTMARGGDVFIVTRIPTAGGAGSSFGRVTLTSSGDPGYGELGAGGTHYLYFVTPAFDPLYTSPPGTARANEAATVHGQTFITK